MYTIAIDLGGTLIKTGLILDNRLVEFSTIKAESEKGLVPQLGALKTIIDDIIKKYRITENNFSGIGLAFPGLVNTDKRYVISTNEKYDDACQLDLDLWVKQNWNCPFFIDNDARLAAVGEWKYGAARGKNNVVMVTIGTGIGTGTIIEGKVLRGKHYQAGSLGGHFIVDYKGRSCSCGNIGCVEALASSFFLPQIIREHPGLSDEYKKQAEDTDFKKIFSQADKENPDALILRDQCMEIWSAAIISYIHAYDPETIVLGGGIMNSRNIILPYIQERVRQLAWCPMEKVDVVASELGDTAALLGLEYCLLNQKIK